MTEAGRQAEGAPKVPQSRPLGPEELPGGTPEPWPAEVFWPKGQGRHCGGGSALGKAVALLASAPHFASLNVKIGGRGRAGEHGHKQTPAASLSPSPRTLRQPCQEPGPAWAWRINMSLRGQAAGPLEPRTAEGCKQSLFSWPQTLAYLLALGISTLSAIKKGQAGVGALGEGWVVSKEAGLAQGQYLHPQGLEVSPFLKKTVGDCE